MTARNDEPVYGSDGLIARSSGFWAHEKLDRLETYSGLVTKSMQKASWKDLVFIDLMAGPGLCIDKKEKTEFRGSTLRALSTPHPFGRVIAIEKDGDCADALRTRVARHSRGSTCEVLTADCNSPDVIATIRSRTAGALSLMFVDLIGTEVTMATLREITNDRSVDLVITWPEMDANRNRGRLIEQEARWSAFFGTPEWIEIAKRGPTRRIRGLTDLYCRQLQKVGYKTQLMDSVKNYRRGRLYRPLFATRHPLGAKFWTVSAPKSASLFDLLS